MPFFDRQCALLLLACYASLSHSQTQPIKVALPSSMPPYVISASNSGIALDIIANIYRERGREVIFSFLPNHRAAKEFLNKVHTLAFAIPINYPVFYSDAVLSFKNVAISLSANDLKLKDVTDLANKQVTAFQNARNFLGDKFKQMAANNPNYSEVTNQQHQLTLLFKGRTDVIIIEQRIFWYHFAQLNLASAIAQKFRIHPLFKAAPRYSAFHSEKQRDTFNLGLKKLRNSPKYQAIFDQYLNDLKSVHP